MKNDPIDRVEVNDESDVILPNELQNLTTLLDSSLEAIGLGNSEIQAEALSTAKHIFELSVCSEAVSRPHILDLIASLSPFQVPQTRSQAKANAEALLHEHTNPDFFQSAPLNTLFTNGMDDEQIWAQLDLRTQAICRMLDYILERDFSPPDPLSKHEDSAEEEDDDDDGRLQKALEALKRDEDIDLDEFLTHYGLDGSDLDDSQGDDLEDSSTESDGGEEEMQEDISPLRDPSSSEEETSGYPSSLIKTSRKRKRGDPSELDDGFFDLAEFNADTERAEAKSSTRGRLGGDDSDEDEEEIYLFANVDSNVDLGDDGKGDQDIFYRDFFEPPSKIRRTSSKSSNGLGVRFHEDVRVRKIKATGKSRSLRDDDLDPDFILDEDDSDGEDDSNCEGDNSGVQGEAHNSDEHPQEGSDDGSDDESMEGATVRRLKYDLFAEETEEKHDDMTTHEKRMAAIREQIVQLESENVAPKEWMLLGEAGSRQRPQNSLLEEDFEFERVRKAAPVVTEEVVHSIEERIKARILQGQFDDVVRIKPVEETPFLPSKLIELQDTKSKESLAQIYEAEYLESQPGGQLPDDRDGRLKKEHEEITRMWDKICNKLDALSNAHFVPKQPKATITTVENTPSVLTESTLPTSKSAASMLAPEEVFSASISLFKAPSELTPAEKRARRTKERKLRKRQWDVLEKSINKLVKPKGAAGVKKEKQAALKSLVKQGKGVTVMGKESVSQGKRKKK